MTSRNLLTADLHDDAAVVENTQAPPATVLLQRLQDQIPTQERFMASWNRDVEFIELLVFLDHLFGGNVFHGKAHSREYHISGKDKTASAPR